MGPSVKFVLAIKEAILKEMGALFWKKTKLRGGEARLFWVFFSSPSLRYLCVVIFTWIISQCDWISTCSLWGSCSRMQCCQFPDHRGCEYNHKLEQISWNDRNGRDDWFVDLWIVQNGFFLFPDCAISNNLQWSQRKKWMIGFGCSQVCAYRVHR